MKLTERLEKIASLVSKGARVADVGTDHGYIPIDLLEKGIIEEAILSDINKGPLNNAREEIERQNLQEKTELRLGGGLEVYEPNEVDEVIIAGMGGILIADILEARTEVARSAKKLILQPMQSPEVLRRYLMKNGYRIIDEHMVNEDFRIYEIIEARYEEGYSEEIEDIYYEVPKVLVDRKEPLLQKFIEKKLVKCSNIIANMGDHDSQEVVEKKKAIAKKEERLKELLEEAK